MAPGGALVSKLKLLLRFSVLLGVCSLLLAGLAERERMQWRLDILQRKLSGGAPEWPWPLVLGAMIPGIQAGTDARRELRLLRGPVRLLRRDKSSPCPVLWETPLGPMWAWEEDQTFLMWHTVRWSHLQTLFPEAPSIPRGGVVLEVGAWVGTFVREALNQGASKVIALEPEPANFVCMQKNFESEIASGRVVLLKAAAWSHDGTEKFGHPELDENGDKQYGGEGFQALPDGDVIVRTVRIDTLVNELGLDRLDVIEMDIEGTERHALQGARATLARFSPQILVCEHHLPDDAEVVPREIHAANPAYVRYSKEGHGYYRLPTPKQGGGL